MWKLLFVTVIIVGVGEAQRSTYAGRPGYHSKLLPRFRENETDSGLGTRGGEESSESAPSTTTLSPDLQGTLEDHRFVHRVSQWPEDRQPFWFKNRYAISTMRGKDIDGGNFEGPNFESRRPRPQFQSPFQGPGRGRGRDRSPSRLFENDEPFYNGLFSDPFPFYQRRLNYR